MVALVVSLVLTFAMAGALFAYGIKRPVGKPLTWGEAILGGTYVFFLMFWMYGVVPHQWLTLADDPLKWRNDAILAGPGSKGAMTWLPFSITKQTVARPHRRGDLRSCSSAPDRRCGPCGRTGARPSPSRSRRRRTAVRW